jgi:hypothetical protein
VPLLALIVALAHPGVTAKTGFAYGRTGGNIIPFTVKIATTRAVTATGAAPAHVDTITKERLAELNRVAFVVDFSKLPASTLCKNALPDVAAQFIRVGARTVHVHGSCVPRFNRLWTALNRAVAKPS